MEKSVLTLEILDANIAECEEYVNSGKEEQSTLDFLLDLREDLKDSSEADWAAYNELVDHLPKDDVDQTLIILKGHLLIEKLVRRFIASRLPNSGAFEKQSFTFAQCIALAESMCLDKEEPNLLWLQIKELNTIRNKLAHRLVNENIELRLSNFISSLANKQGLHNKSLTSVISRLYGMLKGLCDIADSDEFKYYK